jgi:hypothetical protein
MAKIAKVDNDIMNGLYATEFGKLAGQHKTSAADWKDDKGAPKGEDAYKDHAEYISVLTSVMADDKSEDFSPNDPLKD